VPGHHPSGVRFLLPLDDVRGNSFHRVTGGLALVFVGELNAADASPSSFGLLHGDEHVSGIRCIRQNVPVRLARAWLNL
jgi:hypothetical protein